MSGVAPKAKLLSVIPIERLKLLSGSGDDTPCVGDIIQLDQSYTDSEGLAMVLAYTLNEANKSKWHLEVYESELGPNLE